MIARLRRELRALIELVLAPALAVFLPWPWAFALFKRLARGRFLYRQASEAALAQAQRRSWAPDPAAWLAMRRLVTLVDHADYYLARTRSNAWMRRHFHISGDWPTPDQPGLLCSFHWGAGMWSLRHVAAQGLKVHALVAPLDSAHFKGQRVLHAYAKARTAIVGNTLGQATLDVSNSLRPVLKALRANEQVLAIVDVPADQVSASQTITLLNMRARVPRGLLRVAADQAIPVTLFLVGFDPDSGRRFLRLVQLGVHQDVDELIATVFTELGKLITENPAAWHFWSEADRFFVADDA